jgi:hypothetical protein
VWELSTLDGKIYNPEDPTIWPKYGPIITSQSNLDGEILKPGAIYDKSNQHFLITAWEKITSSDNTV